MSELDLEDKELLFVISKGFSEKELFEPMKFLENRGCNITICAENTEPVENKIPILPDFSFEEIIPGKYDGIILISSKTNLKKNKILKERIEAFNNLNKLICAIGNSVDLLAAYGILKDKNKENLILNKSSEVEIFGTQIAEKLIQPQIE